MNNSDIRTVDPDRVAAGRPILCPYCSHSASAEPVTGRKGFSRKRVTCTDIDCNRLNQIVEIDADTGEAKTVEGGPPKRLFSSTTRNNQQAKTCIVEGCTQSALGKDGLCRSHYQRWLACGKPDTQAWLEAGAPTKAQWLAMPDQAVVADDSAQADEVCSPRRTQEECEAIVELVRQDLRPDPPHGNDNLSTPLASDAKQA